MAMLSKISLWSTFGKRMQTKVGEPGAAASRDKICCRISWESRVKYIDTGQWLLFDCIGKTQPVLSLLIWVSSSTLTQTHMQTFKLALVRGSG